jgi:hypothetical protein
LAQSLARSVSARQKDINSAAVRGSGAGNGQIKGGGLNSEHGGPNLGTDGLDSGFWYVLYVGYDDGDALFDQRGKEVWRDLADAVKGMLWNVCVCVCVCVYIYIIYIYIYIYIHAHIHTCMYVYVCMHVRALAMQ